MAREYVGEQKLLRDVHHDVKNNLQVLISLLNLEGRFDTYTKKEIIEKSGERIRSMALSHEKVYESEDIAHVNLNSFLTSFVRDMNALSSQPNITTNIDAEDIEVKLDVSIPLGLIINEILSNTAKHAFPNNEEGNLNISLKKDESDAILIISDDGVGMPEDVGPGNSLGMTIIYSLAGQINADLTLDKENGTKYIIKFPIEQ